MTDSPQMPSPVCAANSAGNVSAGFLTRAIALALDIILLNFIFHGLTFLFREQFFAISRYTDFIGFIVVFCYFWLLNGSVGGGRTMGKFLFNIRTQDYEGRALSAGVSFKRTLVQMLSPLFPMGLLNPLFDTTNANQALLNGGLLSLSFGFLISNALLVGLHPMKQGFHDLFGESLTVRSPQPVRYEDLKTQIMAAALGKRTRSARVSLQSAGIAFIAISLVQIYGFFGQVRSESWRAQSAMLKDMKHEFTLEGFTLLDFGIMKKRETTNAKGKTADVLTTGTLQSELPATRTLNRGEAAPARYRFFVFYIANRDFSGEALRADSQIKSHVLALRNWTRERLKRDLSTISGQKILPEDFQVFFIEQFSFFIYTHRKTEANFLYPWTGESPIIEKDS
ncbi:MAG TPA: RDD family protein [Candidatus Sumerlaeota bacterium]|nr:MAG: RDD family protein [candidate division BRC1 bacterium ADurb.Bin183]HOE62407.1 RDD family protein [Candidatus Sumerlaeota bacterium]HRR30918.1 RDD family protein [Candidatus Sumerlaeia bacterium]HON50152.1 RDD family protein [Candidatus Sumerlaeota bacterium]HOR63368.1 RDD family protein [Candidatus Sumerlaeota bacterium]